MMDKRTFLKTVTGAAVAFSFVDDAIAKVAHLSPNDLAQDESFWATIRKGFRLKPDYINLENGYYLMQSQEVLEGFIQNVRDINYEASYYMRTRQFDEKAAVSRQLADMLGCSDKELIITRNTTEALDMVIAGKEWKVGDEAIMAAQDYGAMLDMFKLQAKRYGMVNKVLSLPNDPKTDDEIVLMYENAITDKTKLMLVSHIVNITGQILPIKKICDMAHRKGVEVLVDGAHAFAHIDFKINDLDCDYYGSSLHKWLGCPLGAGLLYVKKDKVEKLWQLFGDMGYKDDDIRKLNHTGTHPVHTDLSIKNAIAFHNKIGIERKEARLRFIQNHWTDKVRHVPNIVLNTPTDKKRSCAIANVGINTLKPAELAKVLFDKYKIWTVAIDYANVKGVRVTPHVYTSTNELDVFVKALTEIAAK